MYAKLFCSMYDGSLATVGPWEALVTFQQLLILADRLGVVDMTPEAIARRTTIPVDIIRTGIASLESPDSLSRDPKLDGRRIVRLAEHRDWGWEIVNFAKYHAIRSAEERREYQRQWQRDKAAKSSAADATPRKSAAKHPIGEWTLGEAEFAWARRNEFRDADIKLAYNQMRDWALADGHRRVNWAAQWRNWLRKMREDGRARK